jgi:site-specific recombinase XerD
MASVRKSILSPYWLADLRVWKAIPGHPRGGYICKTTKSTKIPATEPRDPANRVADEMERIGNERPEGTVDRATFERRVDSLMRAAGLDVPKKEATWREFSDSFLDESDAGTSTLTKYRGEVGQFTGFLGARASHSLRNITHGDVSAFYRGIIESGRSANTARNTTKTVRAVLQRAFLLGYIDQNPAALVRLKSAGESSTREPFTKKQMEAILKVAEGEERTAILFGLTYGLRAGDAVRRRFEEITTQDGIRVISFIPEKKSRAGKKITLPLVGELAKIKGKGLITPALAHNQHPGRFFNGIMARAGIDRKTTTGTGKGRATNAKTFHSLRHTISSWLMDTGADQRMRQLVCDHDDPKQNARYTHGSIRAMSAAIRKAIA